MRKILDGLVIKKTGSKTVKVQIEDVYRHARVERVVKKYGKFLVHDEHDRAKVGDRVVIEESKPFSAKKSWRLRAISGADLPLTAGGK